MPAYTFPIAVNSFLLITPIGNFRFYFFLNNDLEYLPPAVFLGSLTRGLKRLRLKVLLDSKYQRLVYKPGHCTVRKERIYKFQ